MTPYRTYLLCCAAALALPSVAQAQTVAPAPVVVAQDDAAPQDEQEPAITVTGSRLLTSYNSPTPVNVVGEERMDNLNVTNVGDGLNQLPAFRPLTTPSTNSYRASQNIAGRSLDLRGLGPTRTLTLIDGRRTVPSGDDGTFDLNSVPTILIKRSEVVTGGASAAYGADAVAGVVNLILDTRFEGAKGEVNYGISEYGDGQSFYGAFKAGTGFAGGRGHIVVGAEYANEGEVGDFNARDWGRRWYNFIPNPFFNTDPALSNGLPATVATSDVVYLMTYGGVLSTVGPLQGTQFDNNGNLIPFQFGDLFNPAKPSTLMVGGDPGIDNPYGGFLSPLLVPTSHISGLAHAEFDVSDSFTLLAEFSYSDVIGGPTHGAYRTDQSGAIKIKRDNAYLTPATAAAMDGAHVTTIGVSRSSPELGGSDYDSENRTWRGNLGAKGALGGFLWDVSYDHGETWGRLHAQNQRISTRWAQAVDAVFAPAGVPGIPQGTIICRSTIADPTNGCVPANVMGAGKISMAAANWVNTQAWQTRKFVQDQFSANVRGTLFEGWAGPISAAIGGEYRVYTSEGDADANSVAGVFTSNNASILPRTTQRVTEGYLELAVPLLRDSAVGKSLIVDGAVRRTHYSISGDATTWKVGAVYELNDQYMVRVTRSHDIRAPSALELNPNTRSSSQGQTDPKYNISYVIPGVSGGNPNLELERADTFTVGVVLKPNWIPRFRLSLDFYNIKVSGAIDLISVPTAVALCRAGTNPGVCQIGTDANGNTDRILRVFATYQNVNELQARGFELQASYSREMFAGTVDLTVNANYIDTLSTTLPNGETVEYSDVTGNSGQASALFGIPKWKTDVVLTYERRTFGITTQFQYIPSGILNRDWIGPDDPAYTPYLPNSVSNNRVGSAFYINLNARVKLAGSDDHRVELFGTVNNLFDRDPPSNLRLNANPVIFDGIGRYYKIGLRANW